MNPKSKMIALVILAITSIVVIAFYFSSPKTSEQSPKANQETQNSADETPLELVAQKVTLQNGKSFNIQVAKDFTITPAYEGLKRVRFMTKSPDGKLFVTDMHDLSDNTKGKIYILSGFDSETKKFTKITTYLENLRNPNNVAFYTENGQTWLYVALTDKLERYKYQDGDEKPTSEPEVLTTFPDYGLDYKYGGWHLTRTVTFHNDKLYVSVGSSCDLCEEKSDEPTRASIVEMNPDGTESKIYAKGLRNSVGIKWVGNDFFATTMGSDKLGNNAPQDTLTEIKEGKNYGWPYCYEQDDKIMENNREWEKKSINCEEIPLSHTALGAHSAPLGFDYFSNATDKTLHNYFLVALHGSGNRSIGRGYEIIRTSKNTAPEPFITGFLQGDTRYGRPTDILEHENNSFFFTDDFGGVVYFVSKVGE